MKLGRRSAKWVVAVGVAAGVAALIWMLMPREPVLVDRATFVTRTEEMYGGERFNENIGIHWLTDQDILFSRFEGPKHEHRIIYRRNIITGMDTNLAGLTRSRDDLGAEVVDDQGVSPDGKWFVCSARWDACLLAEVNGSKFYVYPSAADDCYRKLLWMPDSRHWLELYGVNGACHKLLLHDTDHPKSTVSIPMDRREDLFGEIEAFASSHEGIVVDDPGRADPMDGAEDYDANARHLVNVIRLDLVAPSKPVAPYKVTVPGGSADYQAFVSPRGDQLAWQVMTRRSDPLKAWLHRFLPFVQAPLMLRTEVWVSSLDGSRMHEIGSVSERQKSDEDAPPWLDIKWLPGGSRLSFEYRHNLYTTSAE